MHTGAVGQGLRRHTGVMACLEAQLGKFNAREVPRPWCGGAVLEAPEGFLLNDHCRVLLTGAPVPLGSLSVGFLTAWQPWARWILVWVQ